jgi:2-haloacid dehalogenase
MPALSRPHLTTLTFDCYGTLIDWETGAITALRPLLLRHEIALSDDEIVTAFQDIDGALCEPPYKPYRAVLAGVVDGFGRRFGFPVGKA